METYRLTIKSLLFERVALVSSRNMLATSFSVFLGTFLASFLVIAFLGPQSIWQLRTPYTVCTVIACCFASIACGVYVNLALIRTAAGRQQDGTSGNAGILHVDFFFLANIAMVLTAAVIDHLGS
jgi:hypothetical protein